MIDERRSGIYLTGDIQVLDSDLVVKESREIQINSFVENWMLLLYASFGGTPAVQLPSGTLAFTEQDGTVFEITNPIEDYHTLRMIERDSATDETNRNYGAQLGLVVGSDDGSIYPKAVDNYKLGALIADGYGGGASPDILYGMMNFQPYVIHNNYSGISFARPFNVNNGLGDAVTVNEIGLVVQVHFNGERLLIMRDVLAVPLVIADGDLLNINVIWKAYL